MYIVFLIISSLNTLPTFSSSFQYFLLQLLCDFFLKISFKLLFVCICCICECMPHVCKYSYKSEGIRSLGTGVTDGFGLHVGAGLRSFGRAANIFTMDQFL